MPILLGGGSTDRHNDCVERATQSLGITSLCLGFGVLLVARRHLRRRRDSEFARLRGQAATDPASFVRRSGWIAVRMGVAAGWGCAAVLLAAGHSAPSAGMIGLVVGTPVAVLTATQRRRDLRPA